MERSVVVLPQPLGTEQGEELALRNLERDVLRGADRLAALARIFGV